jgi:hypothetical protein
MLTFLYEVTVKTIYFRILITLHSMFLHLYCYNSDFSQFKKLNIDLQRSLGFSFFNFTI